MKKGFTLIEMLAAVTIFAGILLLVVPAIMNQIKEKQNEISGTTLNTLYEAASLYLDEYDISNDINIGSDYCVSLDKLVMEEYLSSPIIDPTTKKEIPLTKYVKTTLNPNREFENFELVDTNCNNQ